MPPGIPPEPVAAVPPLPEVPALPPAPPLHERMLRREHDVFSTHQPFLTWWGHMKRIALLLGCMAVLAAGADCGKGTLGTPGAGGNSGPPLQGVAAAGGVGPTGVGGDAGGGVCSLPPSPVCGALCGNGVIDTCQYGSAGLCRVTEACDRNAFSGDDCTVLGYGSGSRTCTSTCDIDYSTCSTCLPPNRTLIGCGPAPTRFVSLGPFALAATDSEVGLAQIDLDNLNYGGRLSFSRLDTSLARLDTITLEDTSQPGPEAGEVLDAVAVAPSASGWLIAGCSSKDVFLHTLDAAGKEVARTVVQDFGTAYGCGFGSFSLLSAPGGEALLIWGTYYELSAALIAADGRSVGAPFVLVDPRREGLNGYVTGAWIADAFYLVSPLATWDMQGTTQQVIRVQRVSAGGLAVVADILKNQSAFGPVLASGAGDLRLVYAGLYPGGTPEDQQAIVWRRLGFGGELVGQPLALATYPPFTGILRATAVGDDTVVLLSAADRGALGLARVTLDGRFVRMFDAIAQSPAYGFYDMAMVRRGPELVVGWTWGNQLTLARVVP